MREFDIRLGQCSPDAHYFEGNQERCACGDSLQATQYHGEINELTQLRTENTKLRIVTKDARTIYERIVHQANQGNVVGPDSYIVQDVRASLAALDAKEGG